MVPKFQAIQAAHEILGDPTQKAKYDAERAKLNRPARESDSPAPAFKKPPPPRRADSAYTNGSFPQPGSQPPPRRDASATRYAPQSGPRRPNSAATSANDKFAQFARAAPQQRWDQAKFDEAARAEAFRGMNAMRGGGGMPPTSPLRSRGHPTAQRPPSSNADPYSSGPEPSPGYPGLGRTASGRRFNGPGQPEGDPQSRSAYAQYHRSERERPPSAGAYPDPSAHHRPREADSPSRTPRPFPPDEYPATRPGLSRTSSRYAHGGGERTNVNTGGLGRSASVRNSPIDKRWEDDSGPFGTRTAPDERIPRPRHRSHSPPRPGGPKFQFTSESSSEGEDLPPPDQRAKANIRRTHYDIPSSDSTKSGDDGLSGYFPKTNYNSRVVDDHTYAFPAPEVKHTPLRKVASDIGSPHENHQNQERRTSKDDLPDSRYDIPSLSSPCYTTPKQWPLWAIPSSIFPRASVPSDVNPYTPNGISLNNPTRTPLSSSRPIRGYSYANFNPSDGHDPGSAKGDSQFSAEHWHDTLGNQPHMFSPPDSMAKDRKSPTKTSRNTRAPPRNYATTKDARRDAINGEMDPNIMAGMKHVTPDEARDKASAFQSGRLPNDFAEKVNGQRHESMSSTTTSRPDAVRMESNQSSVPDRPTPDEMDIDSPTPQDGDSLASSEAHYNVTVEEEHSPERSHEPRKNIRRHTSGSNGLNLNDLASSAPFVSSGNGLKDLNDLGDTLPWPSRPAETLNALHRTDSSKLRELNLPRPPKPPHPLTESELDQHSWKRYGDAMTTYMHDWNKFNNAMIEHFRSRQEAVTHGMYRNWVCAQGDGASADEFEASGGTDRAGYATYMTWLEDDRKCRTWWDIAFEEHKVCMEGLGKVRRRVKELGGAG